MLRLFVVTKQQVVAMACDGFGTQPRNDDGMFNYLIFGRIMHGCGIFKGGEMALATYDPDAYCT